MSFFGLVKKCLGKGIISEAQLREEIERGHLRTDALRPVGA